MSEAEKKADLTVNQHIPFAQYEGKDWVVYCKCGERIGVFTKAADAEEALENHVKQAGPL